MNISAVEKKYGLPLRLKLGFSIGDLTTSMPQAVIVFFQLFYTLVFILFDTSYTAVHAGYNSLTLELTSDYDERSSLNGYRMAISIFGTLSAIIFATVLGWYIEDVRQLYIYLGLGLGLLSILPPLIVFRVTRNFRSNPEGKPLPVRESIMTTVRNRPFRIVLGLYLMSWTAASIMATVLVLLYAGARPGQLPGPGCARFSDCLHPSGGLVVKKI